MNYYDLLSTIQINLNLINSLENKVLVYFQNKRKEFNISDDIHPDTKKVIYQLRDRSIIVRVSFQKTPECYNDFVFGEL